MVGQNLSKGDERIRLDDKRELVREFLKTKVS